MGSDLDFELAKVRRDELFREHMAEISRRSESSRSALGWSLAAGVFALMVVVVVLGTAVPAAEVVAAIPALVVPVMVPVVAVTYAVALRVLGL